MKKVILLVGICIMLLCSMITIPAIAQPVIRVPIQNVRMKVVYAADSYFIMTISEIPAGYDVINGKYPGWCVEVGTYMDIEANHSVRLFSSYDSEAEPDSPNWDKVNYIINNRDPYDRQTVQEVIWYFICNDPLPANNTDAQTLASEANAKGDGFIPTYGQKIAIVANVQSGGNPVQHSFFEFDIRMPVELGDLVWFDSINKNGIQEDGEPGIQGVTVRLLNETNATIATTTTDSQGYYSFSGYPEGNYTIQIVPPTQYYRFSPANQGSNDDLDSDVNINTGITPVILAFTGTDDMSWDAGMYTVQEPGDPGGGGTQTPPPETPNQAPTAIGGGPYFVLHGQAITFNGSRSYDSDGTIVSYLWNFGDGTTSDEVIVNHAYTNPGNYTVTLTVTDDDSATDTYTTYARSRLHLPPLAPTLTGLTKISVDTSYQLRMVTSDPDGDMVRFNISWGDGMENTTFFVPSNQNTVMYHRWNTWGYYTIQVYAEDSFNLTSDISRIVVAVDVQYVGDQGYLIDTDSNGEFDAFYSNSTGLQTVAQRQQTGIYLIDRNGDGDFDYQYDPSTNTYREYPEALSPSYTMLLVGVVVVILILLLIGFIMRRRTKPKQ